MDMDKLIEHVIAIEMQKSELKLNDYLEYLDRLEGEDKAILEQITKFLENYIHDHFASEEGYMKRFDYPGYATHKLAHDGFIASFKFLKEHLVSDDNATIAVIDTEQLLSSWWLKHIRVEDKSLGEFLLEKL